MGLIRMSGLSLGLASFLKIPHFLGSCGDPFLGFGSAVEADDVENLNNHVYGPRGYGQGQRLSIYERRLECENSMVSRRSSFWCQLLDSVNSTKRLAQDSLVVQTLMTTTQAAQRILIEENMHLRG